MGVMNSPHKFDMTGYAWSRFRVFSDNSHASVIYDFICGIQPFIRCVRLLKKCTGVE